MDPAVKECFTGIDIPDSRDNMLLEKEGFNRGVDIPCGIV